jgi:purine-binding chemotaxis protein CheW
MSGKEKNGTESSEILQLVSFKICNEEFGVDILSVQEINRMSEITKMPNSPEYVEGVINLRGRVIPVVDLRTKLNFPRVEKNASSRIIIVEVSSRVIGFIVDEVSEVLRIPVGITEAPPSLTAGINSEFITSVAKLEDRLIILIDLERIFSAEDKKEFIETI